MSDDLISRKALLEVIDISFIIPILKMNLRPEHEAVLKIREIIINMPIAFDKEKVIEQLQEASYWESADIYDDDGYKDDYYDSEIIDLDKAIEIVERGGVE